MFHSWMKGAHRACIDDKWFDVENVNVEFDFYWDRAEFVDN